MFRQNKNQRRAGFTMIELVVVIAIIGILAAGSMIGLISTQQKSRDSRRKSDLKQIASALEAYYNDFGQYPTSDAGIIVGCGASGVSDCSWDDTFSVVVNGQTTIYMETMPGDAAVNQDYFYVSDAQGSEFQLYALLENVLDQGVPKDNDGNNLVYQSVTCNDDGDNCNYGVHSTNSSLADTTTP